MVRGRAVVASEGYSPIGFADAGKTLGGTGRRPAPRTVGGAHDLTLEFVGLLGFDDPLRPAVPAAVGECQAAGVRVVMIMR